MFYRAEPQLVQLQREYAELQEKRSSLRQATELLTDLKELQHDCLDYREENPKAKVVVSTYSACVSELLCISAQTPFFSPSFSCTNRYLLCLAFIKQQYFVNCL